MEQNIEFFSQFGQDKWITDKYDLLNNPFKGYFVELGAGNGKYISNTYVLEKYFGWEGICIEPNPNIFPRLQKNRQCITDSSLIYGEKDLELDFSIWPSKHQSLSGIKNDLYYRENQRKMINLENIKIKTKLLINILDKYNAPKFIHYLSLDVEGAELSILETFPFDKYLFGYIIVEYGPYKQKIKQILENNNYICQTRIRRDLYYKCMDEQKNQK